MQRLTDVLRLPRRAALLGALLPFAAAAQSPGTYPNRPVRIVAAYPPGGGLDVPTRLVAGPMGAVLGQSVVVENRAGATGSIAAAAVAASPADGYTLLADASGTAVNPALMAGLPFDYDRDLAPVGLVSMTPLMLVVAVASPIHSLDGLMVAARARPNTLTYASSGIGNGTHLTAALLARRAGVALTHVPYRGASQLMPDVLGGTVDWTFSTMSQAAPLVREGRLRALAVSTPSRVPGFPDIPTVAEQGYPGFQNAEWTALWVPSGTPAAAVARLEAALAAAIADPAVRERLAAIGMQPVGSDAAALRAFNAERRQTLGELIRAEGIRAE